MVMLDGGANCSAISAGRQRGGRGPPPKRNDCSPIRPRWRSNHSRAPRHEKKKIFWDLDFPCGAPGRRPLSFFLDDNRGDLRILVAGAAGQLSACACLQERRRDGRVPGKYRPKGLPLENNPRRVASRRTSRNQLAPASRDGVCGSTVFSIRRADSLLVYCHV